MQNKIFNAIETLDLIEKNVSLIPERREDVLFSIRALKTLNILLADISIWATVPTHISGQGFKDALILVEESVIQHLKGVRK